MFLTWLSLCLGFGIDYLFRRTAKSSILRAVLRRVEKDTRPADLKLTFDLTMLGAVVHTDTSDDFIIAHNKGKLP